jgi:hypothetical protein
VRRRQFRGITAHRAIEQYTPLLHQDTNVRGVDAGLVCEFSQYVLFQFQVSFHKPDLSFVDGGPALDTNQSHSRSSIIALPKKSAPKRPGIYVGLSVRPDIIIQVDIENSDNGYD